MDLVESQEALLADIKETVGVDHTASYVVMIPRIDLWYTRFQKSLLTLIEHSLERGKVAWIMTAREASKCVAPLKSRCSPIRCESIRPIVSSLTHAVRQLFSIADMDQARQAIVHMMMMGFVAQEIIDAIVDHVVSLPLIEKESRSIAVIGVAAHLSKRLKHDDWMSVCLLYKICRMKPAELVSQSPT
jgi:hypothetical protein